MVYTKKMASSELTFQQTYQKKVLHRLFPAFLTAINGQSSGVIEGSLEVTLNIVNILELSKQIPLSQTNLDALFSSLKSDDWQIRLFSSSLLSHSYLAEYQKESKFLLTLLENSLAQSNSTQFYQKFELLLLLQKYEFNSSEISLTIAGNIAVILSKINTPSMIVELVKNHPELLRSTRVLDFIVQDEVSIDAQCNAQIFENLSSNSHQVRLKTMRLIHQKNLFDSSKLKFMIKKLMAIEQCEISVQSDKMMRSKFLAIDSHLSANLEYLQKEAKQVLFNSLLGFLWIRLDSIYEDIKAILIQLLQNEQDQFSRFLTILSKIQQISKIHPSDHQCIMSSSSQQTKLYLSDPFAQQTFNLLTHFQSQNLQYRCVSFFQYFQNLIKVLWNLKFPSTLSSQLLNIFIEFLGEDYSRFYEIPNGVKEIKEEGAYTHESLKPRANNKLQWFLKILLDTSLSQDHQFFVFFKNFLYLIIRQKDEAIQSLAVKCLITHFFPKFKAYQTSLLNFASSDKFKDEVVDFQFQDKPEEVCNLVISILYQKITQGKVRGAQKSAEVTKKIIYRFISGLDQKYISQFIDTWAKSLGLNKEDSIQMNLQNLRPRVLIGFLNSTGMMIDKIGKILTPQAQTIGQILLQIQAYAVSLEEKSASNKQIRRLISGRCFDFISQFVTSSEYVNDFNQQFLSIMEDSIAQLSSLFNKSDSSILRIIVLWSEHSPELFQAKNNLILKNILLMMVQDTTIDLVLLKGLQVIRNLVFNSSSLFQACEMDLINIFNKLLKEKRSQKQFTELVFQILAELTTLDYFQAPEFITIILPVFIDKLTSKDDDANFSNILDTLEHLLLKENEAKRLGYFTELVDLLLIIEELQFRQPFALFLNRVFSFINQQIFQIIEDTNKIQRGGADSQIDSEIFIQSVSNLHIDNKVQSLSIRALYNNFLFCLKYEDFAINQVALQSLEQIVKIGSEKYSSNLIEQFIAKLHKYLQKHYSSQFVLRSVLFVLGVLLNSIKAKKQLILSSFLSLDCLYQQVEGEGKDSVLKSLQSIQIVSRIKALKEVQQSVNKIDPKQIVSWIVPLLRSMFTIQLQKKKAITSKKETQEAHLLKEVLNTYKACIAYIPLSQTFTIMRSLAMKIKQDESQVSKAHCKLLCSLIQGIPQKEVSNSEKNFFDKLKTNIVPALYTQLKGGQTPYIKYYVVTGIYRIISRISDKVQSGMHLSRLMHLVASALTSKQEKVRDKVRETIIQFAQMLAQTELHLLFESLAQTLVKGFQRHVLNFTIHRILKGLNFKTTEKNPSLDRSIPFILPGLKEELFGTLRQEKETSESQAAKLYKEARGGLAEESLAILAQHINFKENALTLIAPLEEILSASQNKRTVNRCNQAFQAIVSGFQKNQSLIQEDALLFIYGIIEKSHEIESKVLGQALNIEKSNWEVKKKTLKQLEAEKLQIQEGGGNERRLTLVRDSRQCKDYVGSMQILQSFALNLFYSLTQKKKITLDSRSQLKPFVSLILKCTKSKNEKVAMNSFKLVLPFLKQKLISEEISILLKDCLETLSRLDSRHNKEMLGLIMKIIHSSLLLLQPQGLQSDVIGDILESIEYNIDFSESVYSLFDILDFVISQTYISAKVYDLVEIVGLKMVQSFDPKTREKCSEIYLKFMLTYPLQDSRLTQHINFMLKNLNYGRVDGRLQILKNVKQFVDTFPETVVLPRLQSIFIFLALRFANQEIHTARSLIQEALQIVVNKSDNSSQLLETALLWLQEDNTTKLAFDLLQALHANKKVQLFFKKNLIKLFSICEEQESSLLGVIQSEEELEVEALSLFASALRLEERLLFMFKKQGLKHLKETDKLKLLNKLFQSVDEFDLLHCALKMQWRVLQTLQPKDIAEDEIKTCLSSTILLFNCKFQHDQFSSQLVTNLVFFIENILARGASEEFFPFIFGEIDKIYSVIFQTEASAKLQAQPLFKFFISFIQAISKIQKAEEDVLERWAKAFLKLAYRLLSDEHYEGSQLQTQAESILEKLKARCKNFSKALVAARKEVDSLRKERRHGVSQLKLNKPEVATLKRIKKQERKKLKLKEKHAKARLMK